MSMKGYFITFVKYNTSFNVYVHKFHEEKL